jgi:phage-related protein
MSEQDRKAVAFEGSSLADLRDWPDAVKTEAGYQIDRVQQGLEPDSWKPFKTVGQGVKEIRIAESGDQYRVMYVQVIEDTVHVLHCFRKKTRQTPQRDVDLAKRRYRDLINRSRKEK